MNTIKPGQTLTCRSSCDYDTIFSVEVLERKGQFVTVKAEGIVKRMKIHVYDNEEFIYAFGKYSMCPIFRAPKDVPARSVDAGDDLDTELFEP